MDPIGCNMCLRIVCIMQSYTQTDREQRTTPLLRLLPYLREINPRYDVSTLFLHAIQAFKTTTSYRHGPWSRRLSRRYLGATTNPLFRRDEATDKYLRATGNYVKRYCSALTSVAELRRFKICTFPGYLRFPADVSRESMERADAIYHSTSAVLRLSCLLKINLEIKLKLALIMCASIRALLTFLFFSNKYIFINNMISAVSFLFKCEY